MPPKNASSSSNSSPSSSIRGERRTGTKNSRSNANSNAKANSNAFGGPQCSTSTRVLLYVLLAAVIAAAVYVLYRVIVYSSRGRKSDKKAKKENENENEKASLDPARVSDMYYSSQRLYEGFEDEIADEPGDDYDGSEGKRVRDRKKQKEKSANNTANNKKEEEVGKIVYFHMDGCGHCRRFDPTWKEFTAKYSEELAKMGMGLASYEARDDMARDMEIRGFPSVVFVDKEGKKADVFKGPRTVPSLIKFARSHA